jgi:hypothetical protein
MFRRGLGNRLILAPDYKKYQDSFLKQGLVAGLIRMQNSLNSKVRAGNSFFQMESVLQQRHGIRWDEWTLSSYDPITSYQGINTLNGSFQKN